MEIYSSEQEQVEAIKKWWDENGKQALVALTVVLASVGGYRWWQGHQLAQAEAASLQYQVVLQGMESDPEKASEQARQLLGSYSGSTYAELAELLLAKQAVEGGDLEAAAAHLHSVADNSKHKELQALASVRLARVLLAKGDAAAAKGVLDGLDDALLPALQQEVLGDVLLSQGDRRGARSAYAKALFGYASNPTKRDLMQMKVDDLADAKDAQS